jgi:hypothetical protein
MDSNLNTDTRAPEATGFAAPETPSINLPKGGGAIRNMGEKFSTNPVSGTGSTRPRGMARSVSAGT